MAFTKLQAEGINLADTFAFTGTVSGAGGGKILNYQYSTDTADRSGTAGTEAVTGLTFSYTPSAATSRLLINLTVPCATFDASTSAVRVRWRVRTGTTTSGTVLAVGQMGDYEDEVNVSAFDAIQTFTFIHHPNTTSAQSYCLTVEDVSGTATWSCSGLSNSCISTISILEIDGS